MKPPVHGEPRLVGTGGSQRLYLDPGATHRADHYATGCLD